MHVSWVRGLLMRARMRCLSGEPGQLQYISFITPVAYVIMIPACARCLRGTM